MEEKRRRDERLSGAAGWKFTKLEVKVVNCPFRTSLFYFEKLPNFFTNSTNRWATAKKGVKMFCFAHKINRGYETEKVLCIFLSTLGIYSLCSGLAMMGSAVFSKSVLKNKKKKKKQRNKKSQ